MSAVTGVETDAEKISRLQGLVFKLEKDLKDSEANCNRIIAASQRGDKVDVLQLEGQVETLTSQIQAIREGKLTLNDNEIQQAVTISNLEGEIVNLNKRIEGHMSEHHSVEQALGQALGYPWYRDDEKNVPDATDADGVCTGEHTPSTIALEAGKKITELNAEIKRLKETTFTAEQWDDISTKLEEARDLQVSYFDIDFPPRAQQGAPRHGIEDVITADQVNFLIRRIQELTEGQSNLQALLDGRNAEVQGYLSQLTAMREVSEENRRQNNWRAERISQVESLLQWALRKVVHAYQAQMTITEIDRDRANEIFERIFPNMDRIRLRPRAIAPRPVRRDPNGNIVGQTMNMNIPTPPRAMRNDAADAAGYAMAAQPSAWGGGGAGARG
jgi:hypothetical protein